LQNGQANVSLHRSGMEKAARAQKDGSGHGEIHGIKINVITGK
jgi:hypothetical protein